MAEKEKLGPPTMCSYWSLRLLRALPRLHSQRNHSEQQERNETCMNLARARFAMQVFLHLLAACQILKSTRQGGSGLALLWPIIALPLLPLHARKERPRNRGAFSAPPKPSGPLSRQPSSRPWGSKAAKARKERASFDESSDGKVGSLVAHAERGCLRRGSSNSSSRTPAGCDFAKKN